MSCRMTLGRKPSGPQGPSFQAQTLEWSSLTSGQIGTFGCQLLLDGGHPGVQLTFHHLATQDKVPCFLGAHHLVAG